MYGGVSSSANANAILEKGALGDKPGKNPELLYRICDVFNFTLQHRDSEHDLSEELCSTFPHKIKLPLNVQVITWFNASKDQRKCNEFGFFAIRDFVLYWQKYKCILCL